MALKELWNHAGEWKKSHSNAGGKRNVWISTPELEADLLQYAIFFPDHQDRNINTLEREKKCYKT